MHTWYYILDSRESWSYTFMTGCKQGAGRSGVMLSRETSVDCCWTCQSTGILWIPNEVKLRHGSWSWFSANMEWQSKIKLVYWIYDVGSYVESLLMGYNSKAIYYSHFCFHQVVLLIWPRRLTRRKNFWKAELAVRRNYGWSGALIDFASLWIRPFTRSKVDTSFYFHPPLSFQICAKAQVRVM